VKSTFLAAILALQLCVSLCLISQDVPLDEIVAQAGRSKPEEAVAR
jgi:hypothetical protein